MKRRQAGSIPCGKRTEFGYEKDFDSRYTIGKLLGHGQFGYTYAAIDNCNGESVAVKKIEKNKVNFPPPLLEIVIENYSYLVNYILSIVLWY